MQWDEVCLFGYQNFIFSDCNSIRWNSAKDPTGAYMIDRSPLYFETILNYLRHGQLTPEANLNLEGKKMFMKFSIGAVAEISIWA